MKLIRVEDDSTNFIDIGPVNKTINMLSIFYNDGKDSETFKKHYDRIFDYLWLANDGMKMQVGFSGNVTCNYFLRGIMDRNCGILRLLCRRLLSLG